MRSPPISLNRKYGGIKTMIIQPPPPKKLKIKNKLSLGGE
jgi:hypothetical protein